MLVADGSYFLIECAVRADGVTSHVADFLHDLAEGRWEREHAEAMPPDEQVHFKDWFDEAMWMLADEGIPPSGGYNQLMDGIWEIKHWDVRVSLFDTDGNGNYEPKIDRDWHPWQVPWPEFDEYLRLGTVWDKIGQQAGDANIELAKEVREEDLAHDC